MNVVKCFDHELCDLHHRHGHFLHSVKLLTLLTFENNHRNNNRTLT